MRQILQRLVVFGSDKPVFCILPYGLDCAELRRRGRQVQDLQPVVLLQILQHIPVLVLACVVRYEENLAPLELMRNPPILGGADRNGNQILQV